MTKFLIYGLAVILAAATLFWASGFLGVIAFASPQNPGWKTALYLLAYCGLPLVLTGGFIAKSLQSLWRGRSRLALALILFPTLLVGAALASLYGLLAE